MLERNAIPAPATGERPALYADRLGQRYCAGLSPGRRKDLGQYFTPPAVADMMAECAEIPSGSVSILDPGAGSGILTCALCERLARGANPPTAVTVRAYEIDQRLASLLDNALAYLGSYLDERGIRLSYHIATEDFVQVNGGRQSPDGHLFANDGHGQQYDIAIANPPYFKLAKSDRRARSADYVVHGQPNIYSLFMAVSASLLREGGELIFITPRSYASGPYFRRFREVLFSKVRPTRLHVFDSRSKAFQRDSVLQENVITVARRETAWCSDESSPCEVISSSNGAHDLHARRERCVPVGSVLDMRTRDKVLSIPTDAYADDIRSLVHSWTGSLHAYGLQISTGPVVAFRAAQHIITVPDSENWAPLLWLQNVRPMQTSWPTTLGRKPQYMQVKPRSLPLLLPNTNYVLLRRFSSKEQPKRLVAAPWLPHSTTSEWLGVENHLNYIYRARGELTVNEALGLAVLLNSELLETYFRCINGNTQVSATELRAMPLPPLEAIAEMGRLAAQRVDPSADVGALVCRVLDGVSFVGGEEATG